MELVPENTREWALHYAASRNDWGRVYFLLKMKMDPDSRDPDRFWTPLDWAAANGCTNSLAILIYFGAAVDPDEPLISVSPLYIACVRQQLEVAKILLDRGANINWVTIQRTRPIDAAAAANNVPLLALLLDRGADSGPGPLGMTPLHFACRESALQAAKLLIQRGLDIYARANLTNSTCLALCPTADQRNEIRRIYREGGAGAPP